VNAVAALLVVVAIAGGVGYWQGSKHAKTAAELAMAEHLAADRKAESDHRNEVRQLEQILAAAQADVSEAYEKGKKDAETTGAAVTADLRAGNLRLQQRWTSCETQRLSDAAAAAGELDAATRDREESAGRIVRAAAQCDAQVRGLQELLILEREQLNKR
jgi:uncharacterized protein HemX